MLKELQPSQLTIKDIEAYRLLLTIKINKSAKNDKVTMFDIKQEIDNIFNRLKTRCNNSQSAKPL